MVDLKALKDAAWGLLAGFLVFAVPIGGAILAVWLSSAESGWHGIAAAIYAVPAILLSLVIGYIGFTWRYAVQNRGAAIVGLWGFVPLSTVAYPLFKALQGT